MPFLDPPRCPNCNSETDLTELWRTAVKSRDAQFYALGMMCPVCGVKLRVLLGRAQWIGFLAVIIPFALIVLSIFVAPVAQHSMEYKIRTGVFMAALFGATLLQKRYTPRLLTVRLLRDNEKVRFPLAPPPVPEPDAASMSALDLQPTEDDRPNWVCPKCHEENPGNFDECWKCLKIRDEAENAK